MAGGWARDDAVNDQIEISTAEAVARARMRAARGTAAADSASHCTDCDEPIPEARRRAIALATQQAMQERIAAEEQLRRQADEQQKTYQQKITRLTADRDALLRSVRERPSRDSGDDVPGTAAAGDRAGCTGAGLSREDAEFLVGEAARADRIAEQLSACVAQYEAAREAVKRQNSNAVSQ